MPDLTVSEDVDAMLAAANNAAIRTAIGAPATSHTHSGADLTSGNVAVARLANALTAPGPLGSVTPGTVAATILTITSDASAPYFITGAGANDGFYGRSNSAILAMGVLDDVKLTRDTSNALAQRNAGAAQAFRVYNTFTDTADYERAFIRWASDVCEIGTSAAGFGTLRALNLIGSALQINGSAGATATLTTITSITVTNGIVTAITGT